MNPYIAIYCYNLGLSTSEFIDQVYNDRSFHGDVYTGPHGLLRALRIG